MGTPASSLIISIFGGFSALEGPGEALRFAMLNEQYERSIEETVLLYKKVSTNHRRG